MVEECRHDAGFKDGQQLRLFDTFNEILWHLPAKQLCLSSEMHMKKNTLVTI